MKNTGFYFNPKKWLGDSNILAMDWDCKAMHLHLIAIAWQNDPKGYILNNDELILKFLNNPKEQDWENRIKPQIMTAWKKKKLTIKNITSEYIYQPGIIKEITKEETPKKKEEKLVIKSNEFDGFDLKSLLNKNESKTINYEKATTEEKDTIWTLGIKILKPALGTEQKTRMFMAKMIKTYGEKPLASAIAKLSIKECKPVEITSYLIGILKNEAKSETKQKIILSI